MHSIPLTGHRNHSLMHLTDKFYGKLVALNGYERLRSEITIGQSDWILAPYTITSCDDDHRMSLLRAVALWPISARLGDRQRKQIAAGAPPPFRPGPVYRSGLTTVNTPSFVLNVPQGLGWVVSGA